MYNSWTREGLTTTLIYPIIYLFMHVVLIPGTVHHLLYIKKSEGWLLFLVVTIKFTNICSITIHFKKLVWAMRCLWSDRQFICKQCHACEHNLYSTLWLSSMSIFNIWQVLHVRKEIQTIGKKSKPICIALKVWIVVLWILLIDEFF